MPEMNGMQVAEKLRGMGYDDLPILALTANSEEADLEEYKKVGMLGCIAKPIDFDFLKGTIADIFKNHGKSVEFRKMEKSNLIEDSEVLRFDAAKGLRLLNNDQELFNGILEKFKINFADTPVKLDTLMSSKDFKTCEIMAHSIKGISANIGALPLSNLARDLENRFKQRKESDISDFQEELKQVIIETDNYLSDKKVSKEKSGSKKKGGVEELRELLEKLQKAVLRNDPVESKKIIKEISGYSFSGAINDSIVKLKKDVSDYDFAGANKTIKEMNKDLEG